MSLPMNFDTVLRTFGTPLPVTVLDTTGSYVDGEWAEADPVARPKPLPAIVLAMSPAKLEQYKEGDSSAAGISLHTKEKLYFTDINNAGQEQRQSYVEYQGYRFRVVGTGFMLGNTNFNLYEAVRYFR